MCNVGTWSTWQRNRTTRRCWVDASWREKDPLEQPKTRLKVGRAQGLVSTNTNLVLLPGCVPEDFEEICASWIGQPLPPGWSVEWVSSSPWSPGRRRTRNITCRNEKRERQEEAVYNYRRSPKNRVKHGTMEWSKFFDDWPHSGVSFSEREVVLYFAAYINKYYITQYPVSLYWNLDFIGYGSFRFLWKVQHHIIAHERQIYSYYWPNSTPWMDYQNWPILLLSSYSSENCKSIWSCYGSGKSFLEWGCIWLASNIPRSRTKNIWLVTLDMNIWILHTL